MVIGGRGKGGRRRADGDERTLSAYGDERMPQSADGEVDEVKGRQGRVWHKAEERRIVVQCRRRRVAGGQVVEEIVKDVQWMIVVGPTITFVPGALLVLLRVTFRFMLPFNCTVKAKRYLHKPGQKCMKTVKLSSS